MSRAVPEIDLQHPLARGLVFAWLPGQATGWTAYDSSVYRHRGTLTAMTPGEDWAVGLGGRPCLTLGGDNDYITVPDHHVLRADGPLSMCALVHATDIMGPPQGVVSTGKLTLKEYDDEWVLEIIGDNSTASWSKSGDVGAGPTGLAVYDGKLYTSCYGSDDVYVFDGTTWSKSGDVGDGPIGLAVYDGKLYTCCYDSHDVYVFDGTTWSKSGDVGDRPYGLAVYDGKLYTSCFGSDEVYVFGNGVAVRSTKSDGWAHVSAVVDDDNVKLYVDGALVASRVHSLSLVGSTLPLLIGGAYGSSQSGATGGNPELLTGSIGDLCMYGRDLTSAEARQLSIAARTGVYPFERRPKIWLAAGAAAGEDYTLTAGQGSFSHTGQDTDLLHDRVVNAGQGSFSLSGQSVDFLRDLLLDAEQGSFSHAGQSADLLYNRLVGADYGGFSLTGQAVTLITGVLGTSLPPYLSPQVPANPFIPELWELARQEIRDALSRIHTDITEGCITHTVVDTVPSKDDMEDGTVVLYESGATRRIYAKINGSVYSTDLT